jgi:AhpD family alkylhydroperoxidase
MSYMGLNATNVCAYCINSHAAAVRKIGLDEASLGELMSVVALFNTTNTLADGYQVQPTSSRHNNRRRALHQGRNAFEGRQHRPACLGLVFDKGKNPPFAVIQCAAG